MLRKIKVGAFFIGAYIFAVVGTAFFIALAAVISLLVVPFAVYPYIQEYSKRIK